MRSACRRRGRWWRWCDLAPLPCNSESMSLQERSSNGATRDGSMLSSRQAWFSQRMNVNVASGSHMRRACCLKRYAHGVKCYCKRMTACSLVHYARQKLCSVRDQVRVQGRHSGLAAPCPRTQIPIHKYLDACEHVKQR